jgi:hypothetical protein
VAKILVSALCPHFTAKADLALHALRASGQSAKNPEFAMPRLIDHQASRALSFRTRAIQLAEQARKEDDKSQRRFLLDKARALVNVADAIDPPQDEPSVFR